MGGGMIVGLLNQVDSICSTFVFHGYQNLVNAYSTAIEGLVCLSIIVFGYALLQGLVELSMTEVSKRVLTIGFVLALAMKWGVFSEYVYALFTNAPSEIAGHIVQSIPGVSFNNQASANAALQQAFYDGMSFVNAAWDRGSYHNIAPYWWSIVLFVVVMALTGIALIELVVAKFGLAIYLVLAPLTIPCFLFQATKSSIFDGWLKHLITFAFIPIFIICALALGLMLMSAADTRIQQDIGSDLLTFTDLAPYILYAVITTGLVIKSTAMAASTAGGLAMGVSHRLGSHATTAKQWLTKNSSGGLSVGSPLGSNTNLSPQNYHNNPEPPKTTQSTN